jgi:hypothetical protein
VEWSELPRYEWIAIELVVLGLLIAELVSVRRSIRRDRDKAEQEKKRADEKRDDGEPLPGA